MFKKIIVLTFFWRFQMHKFETLRTSISKKIILITNFINTTHFTLTNILENYDHCFQKGSGNHYLKVISATPFISTRFSIVPLMQDGIMFNISKYNNLKENYSSKLFWILVVACIFWAVLELLLKQNCLILKIPDKKVILTVVISKHSR